MDLTKSDRELFEDLPLGDIWIESQCHVVIDYLLTSKHLRTEVSDLVLWICCGNW